MIEATARLLALGVVAFTLPLAAGSGALMPGKADDLGFAHRPHATHSRGGAAHVDAGEVSGVVTLVARRGKIAHFEAYGLHGPRVEEADAEGRHLPAGVDVEADHRARR